MSKFLSMLQAPRPISRQVYHSAVRFTAAKHVFNYSTSILSSTVCRHTSSMTPVFSEDGVPPIGPYSQAIKANGFIWLSGQIPANKKCELTTGTVTDKTHQMIKNARSVLQAAGSDLDKVVKVTVYFENLDDYAEFNRVYAEYFFHHPARSGIESRRLPAGASMEMDLVALE